MSIPCDYGHDVDDDAPFPQALPPRRDGDGCPACGAEVTPTKSRETWPQHPVGGVKGAPRCGLSGRRIGFETDDYFRTFFDRDHPPHSDPDCGHYYVRTAIVDNGDAFGLESQVVVPDGYVQQVVARVVTRVTQDDYPRFRDELDRVARRRGWIDADGAKPT